MTFDAKFPGRCPAPSCDRRIEPGDAVTYVDDQLVHDECALDAGVPEPATREVCSQCFIETAANGTCAC